MTSKKSSTAISPFDLLPDEIWLKIFTELPVATICLCRVVSKKWYYLSLDETLWQYHSSHLFKPGPLPPRTSSTLNSWESFYRLQINWQRGNATKTFNFKAHNNKVVALKLRGDILVTGSTDDFIGVWNIKTGECKNKIEVGADIICVDFIEHKDVIACGSYYGEFGCKLISFSTGETLGKFAEEQWIGTQCMDMNDEYIALGTFKGMIHVLLWKDGRKVALFHVHSNRVAGVRLLGKNIVMSVSSNGAIDIFDITSSGLLYQYVPSRTSINICSFDNNVDGHDILCIAPSGAIFHIRWEDLPPPSFNEGEREGEDERIRRIYSREPMMIYENNNVPCRLLCAGIDSKYNHGVIGSLISYPPQGHLLIYPKVNSESVDVTNGIRGFNEVTLPPSIDTTVFNILDIDDERVVAGCTRGWIYCFEFTVDQEKEKKEKNVKGEEENEEIKNSRLSFKTTQSRMSLKKFSNSVPVKTKCNTWPNEKEADNNKENSTENLIENLYVNCSFEKFDSDQERGHEEIEEKEGEEKEETKQVQNGNEEFTNEENFIKDIKDLYCNNKVFI
ncbi:WD40 repeat-like protein [Rhizophagus irregularis]|uniref:WD40 repeat-like protein n=1 Tax=Rhizophagus irregularis TaxID=588596 RepID=A0A2I1GQN9_9GLOM|nr:WD40 repeat-like protein [Rhizophagus irregularis]